MDLSVWIILDAFTLIKCVLKVVSPVISNMILKKSKKTPIKMLFNIHLICA